MWPNPSYTEAGVASTIPGLCSFYKWEVSIASLQWRIPQIRKASLDPEWPKHNDKWHHSWLLQLPSMQCSSHTEFCLAFLSSYFTLGTFLSISHICSHLILTKPYDVSTICFLFYQRENWGKEKLNHFLKVPAPVLYHILMWFKAVVP